MTKYKVYIIDTNGDGHVQSLMDWDGDEILELRLAAFAPDAMISIEPYAAEEEE